MGDFERALESLPRGEEGGSTVIEPDPSNTTYDQFEPKNGTDEKKPTSVLKILLGVVALGILIVCMLGLAYWVGSIFSAPTSEGENPTDSAPPPPIQEEAPEPSPMPVQSSDEEPAPTIPERNFPIQIAYVIGTSEENAGIYVADSNGGSRDLLTSSDCDSSVPHWSPDGTSILFQSDCGGTYDIWQVSANGSSPFMIFGSPGYDDREAHYALSGDQIVYVRHELGVSYNTNGDIRIYSNGSDRSTGLSGRGPVFSPDSSKLAYMHLDGGTWQIFVYNLDSGDNSQITFGDDSRWPAWSPDGQEIAYNSATGQGTNPTGIWTVSADGGDPQLVIEGSYGRPSWSESNLILFNSPDGLWVIRPNGGGLEQLTSDYGWAGSWSR